MVFFGSATALVLASLLGAAAGGSLAAVIPAPWLKLVAAVGFVWIEPACCWRPERKPEELNHCRRAWPGSARSVPLPTVPFHQGLRSEGGNSSLGA